MNENEFDRTARAWLQDGPTQMSDRALLSALEEIHTTRQRRVVWPAWRAAPRSMFARVAVATAVLGAVGLLGVNVLQRQPDGASPAAPPSPSPTAAPTHSPAPSGSPAQAFDVPELTATFVSPTNGFSFDYVDRGEGSLSPVERLWGFEQVTDRFDLAETGYGAVFKGASVEIPDGVSIDDWIDASVAGTASTPTCMLPRSRQATITIDGQPGRISENCAKQFVATVVAGGRLYVFVLVHSWDDEAAARSFFDDFVASIDLTPGTATDAPSPTTTFVSPTNGFSVEHLAGGDDPPAVDDQANLPFDIVDIGASRRFMGASTAIPDGVSIDAWIDDAVREKVGGCGAPRSQQEEITIDGQAGRISECPYQIVATVVAGGRFYLFRVAHDGAATRAFVDSFIATIDLRPELVR
jgi:hypothetical protein